MLLKETVQSYRTSLEKQPQYVSAAHNLQPATSTSEGVDKDITSLLAQFNVCNISNYNVVNWPVNRERECAEYYNKWHNNIFS